MNGAGCSPSILRDTFFLMGSENEDDAPCFIPIAFFVIFLSVSSLILGTVAYSRTLFIYKRVRTMSKTRKGGRLNGTQIVTITQSWATFVVIVATLIVPLTYGTESNVMVLLFGLHSTLFWIASVRWLRKLFRLGSRIISARNPLDDSTGDHLPMSEDSLAKLDGVLKVLMTSVYLGVLFQFIVLCILGMVQQTVRYWFLIGLGTIAYLTLGLMLIFVYHYQRCKWAILRANERVHAMRLDGEISGTLVAVQKFTKHQIVLLISGMPGTLVIFLTAIEIIPLTYLIFFVTILCDVVCNGGMFFVFIRKGSKPKEKSSRLVQSNAPTDRIEIPTTTLRASGRQQPGGQVSLVLSNVEN